jgi:hypothetical protein
MRLPAAPAKRIRLSGEWLDRDFRVPEINWAELADAGIGVGDRVA